MKISKKIFDTYVCRDIIGLDDGEVAVLRVAFCDLYCLDFGWRPEKKRYGSFLGLKTMFLETNILAYCSQDVCRKLEGS